MTRKALSLLLAAAVLPLAVPGARGQEAASREEFENRLREGARDARPRTAALRESAARNATAGAPDPAACAPENPQEPKLGYADFRWDYTLPELIRRFDEIYASPKRLGARAYWNPAQSRFEFPEEAARGGPVELPEAFVRAVARHAERAFEDGLIDAVFFPDMGHSHFLIPEELYARKYEAYTPDRFSRMYEEMFRDPELKVLYHTAEQLKTRGQDGRLIDDPRTRRRYETRNIVGTNSAASGLEIHQNPDSKANTVHEVPGYFWWGAGFNLSANENGCFSFSAQGRTYRFDLSLRDLE